MKVWHPVLASGVIVSALTLARCGAGSSPTGGPTPPIATPTPTPTASPTPSLGLPAGMTCDPTPPPILRMRIGVFDDSGDRKVLDSEPLVVNVDNYCDRVGFGSWKFCATRQEGHPERVACDYLVAGKAEDTERWGPTWFYGSDLCSYFPGSCANHNNNQFMAVAKDKGIYEACASEDWPVAANGTRCGTIEIK